MSLVYIVYVFFFYLEAGDIGEIHSLIPGTLQNLPGQQKTEETEQYDAMVMLCTCI
jgi:hypothetical protein